MDLVLASSNIEAQQVLRRERVPAERVAVVPQRADAALATADPEPFAQRVGRRDFVLYTGPIAPGENQLAFLWAMHELQLPAVVLGDAVPGYEWYLAQCRRVAGPQVRFVPQLCTRRSPIGQCVCRLRVPGAYALVAGVAQRPLEAADVGHPAGALAGRLCRRVFRPPGLVRAAGRRGGHSPGRVYRVGAGGVPPWPSTCAPDFSLAAMSRAMRQAYARLLGPRGH